MPGGRLLERDDERAALLAALDGAERGRGGVVIVEAAAGLGKSALLETAGALAAERGARVLAAHGGVLEQGVGWEAVRQLLEPLLVGPDAVEGLLDGPGRAARPVFGLPEPPAGATFPVDVAPRLEHALFRLLAQLAEQALVLVSVDDVHWVDEASLRWLVYLARRSQRLSLVVVAARRLGEPSAHEALLDELAARARRAAAGAGAVERGGGGRARRGGVLDAGRAGVRARVSGGVTGGNPFLLGELLGDARGRPRRPSADAERRVRTLQPERVVAEVTRRLGRLSPQPSSSRARSHCSTERPSCATPSPWPACPCRPVKLRRTSCTFARLLRAGRPLRFAHPLLRAAVEARSATGPARGGAPARGALLDAEPDARRSSRRTPARLRARGRCLGRARLRAAGERAIARARPGGGAAPRASAARTVRRAGTASRAGARLSAAGPARVAAGELAVALAAWPQVPCASRSRASSPRRSR